MIRFILRALVAAAGLWVASKIIPGVQMENWKTLVLAGLVLGIVNALVRPIVTFLTLPVTILTLGLFLLIVNGLMILLTSWVVDHFPGLHMHIGSLLNSVLVTIVVWLVSLVGNMFLGDEENRSQRRR
ncbi:MAG TPA: phage holin family protein [Caulobacteraceae bacterium]|jgi:putative membrane protein|nr:phage holin family protein [Caulobacteraceae bacterium]